MALVCRIFPTILTNFRQIYVTPIRTIIRDHFPRPNERRRVLRHGWKKRMSTPGGRRVLMNRILKGRFVYSH